MSAARTAKLEVSRLDNALVVLREEYRRRKGQPEALTAIHAVGSLLNVRRVHELARSEELARKPRRR